MSRRLSAARRFQRRAKRSEQAGVITWSGVDAVTGLPVLVYDIPDDPRREARELESEHIPGVLASSFDGRHGELVVAFATDYRPVDEEQVDDAIVLAGATALRDAARAGVVHGDLRPGRFLIASGHLLVEGYGVPWQPLDDSHAPSDESAGLPADVHAFASTFLELGRGGLGPEVVAALESAMAAPPEERPEASELLGMLERHVGAHVGARPSPVPASPLPPSPMPADREPLVIDSDAGEALLETPRLRKGSPKPSSGGFSKEPPPGTRYRAGSEAPAPEPARLGFPSLHDAQTQGLDPWRWYRFAVLGATLVLTAVLAFLFLSRQSDRFASPATRAVVYVVDVMVEPSELPPVRLFVVDGPDASKWQPGTELGNVPGRVVLDREGTWQFQGRFQDRLSRVATLQLPAQREVTLDFTSTRAVTNP